MDASIDIRCLEAEDVMTACQLVATVFDEFVAPDYSAEGVAEFRRYITPEAMRARLREGHAGWIAVADGRTIGMIEVRGTDHVSLMFVDGAHHGRGIARALLEATMAAWRSAGDAPRAISVNSSRCAVRAYEHLGFRVTGEEQTRNGITFVPMVREAER